MKNAKNLFFAVALALCFTNLAFASEIIADSRIQEVTVYPDSALINRVANLKLNPGVHQVIFSDIIPELDENSLRVRSINIEDIKIMGAQVKKEFLEEEAAERIKGLKDEIQKLEDERKVLEDSKRVLAEEKRFLDSIQLFSKDQIPEDLVTKIPQVSELESILNFLSTNLKKNFAQIIQLDNGIREIDKKLEALRRELSQISGGQRKLKRSIMVELEVLKPVSSDLSISYLVRGASWQPIYDARASFEKSQVELVSYGIVRQKTGEDWTDVQMVFSTAKPAIGGRMPYVSPWFLRPIEPRKRQASRGDLMMEKMATLGSQYEAFVGGIGAPEEAESIPMSIVEEKGIAVTYTLPKKVTVKADGSENKLPISSQILEAKYEYSSYPRAILNAYLGSRVTNAPNLQLLAGRVNIFLEGDFVGISSIDNVGPGEEFDLYLGADENVKVKREQVEKKVDETLIAGIPAKTKRTTFKYKLTLENYKSRKITVKLFEAMPVSEDERIKVKIDKVSLEPKEKDWKDRKGVWLWELELEPKQKREIFYTFIVEHPREMVVEGL